VCRGQLNHIPGTRPVKIRVSTVESLFGTWWHGLSSSTLPSSEIASHCIAPLTQLVQYDAMRCNNAMRCNAIICRQRLAGLGLWSTPRWLVPMREAVPRQWLNRSLLHVAALRHRTRRARVADGVGRNNRMNDATAGVFTKRWIVDHVRRTGALRRRPQNPTRSTRGWPKNLVAISRSSGQMAGYLGQSRRCVKMITEECFGVADLSAQAASACLRLAMKPDQTMLATAYARLFRVTPGMTTIPIPRA
jgi:hypothetical protein